MIPLPPPCQPVSPGLCLFGILLVDAVLMSALIVAALQSERRRM